MLANKTMFEAIVSHFESAETVVIFDDNIKFLKINGKQAESLAEFFVWATATALKHGSPCWSAYHWSG